MNGIRPETVQQVGVVLIDQMDEDLPTAGINKRLVFCLEVRSFEPQLHQLLVYPTHQVDVGEVVELDGRITHVELARVSELFHPPSYF